MGVDEVKDDVCDICAELGDRTIKRVKTMLEIVVCKPCYLSMKAIQD